MVDRAVSKSTPMGDFLQHFESAGVCFESGFLVGSVGGADNLDMCGYPVKGTPAAGFTLALEADAAAGITGWIIAQGFLTLAAAEVSERKYLILARGPAVVVEESLPIVDAAGTDFTQASLLAALEAAGIQTRNIPPETSVQTT